MLLPDDHPAVVRDVAKRAKRRLQVSSTHLGLMLFFHMYIFSFVSMWPLYVYTHPIPRKPDPKLKWIARHRTWAKDKEVRKFDCVESVSKTSSLGVFGSDKFTANVGRLISKRWTKKDFLPRSTQKLLNKSRATERWRLVSQCVCFFDSNCVWVGLISYYCPPNRLATSWLHTMKAWASSTPVRVWGKCQFWRRTRRISCAWRHSGCSF